MTNNLVMRKLKNGSEEAESGVEAIMGALDQILENHGVLGLIAALDLVDHCRNKKPIEGKQFELLRRLSLLDEKGKTHDVIRNVVLSSVVGENYKITFGSPYAE